ncbi:MAG: class I SAM-dependent methyltransferase [Reichenbachiella sp.]
MKDVHGHAILDFYKGVFKAPLLLHNSYGAPEEMPVEVFFRDPDELSELENTAITNCRGTVLDLGAGAGAHALLLQSFECDITALDNSPGCIETMTLSGMNNVVEQDYKKHKSKYDTILLLMNGLGIAGTLNGVEELINQCKKLLNEGGQILVDSSDISYLYNDGLEKPDSYFGNIKYQYEYKGSKGEWFDWVYVDQDSLSEITKRMGLDLEILFEDENDQYLAKINI